MSPSAKLLRLIVAELESKATQEEIPDKIRNKDVSVLANNEKVTTVGAWLRDESRNRQFSALVALLSYLPLSTISEIFGKVLPEKPVSIKQTLESNQRLRKAERKTKKKPARSIDPSSRLN
jgi:hypothetical protein